MRRVGTRFFGLNRMDLVTSPQWLLVPIWVVLQSYLGQRLESLTQRIGTGFLQSVIENKGQVLFGPGNLEIQAGDAYWSVYHSLWNPLRWRHEKITTERYVRLYVRYRRVPNRNADTRVIEYSNEQLEKAVKEAYQFCLGRNPEPSGLNNWMNEMQRNGIESMRGGICASPEAKSYSARKAVQVVYQTCLGREPEETGWNNWINEMLQNGYDSMRGEFLRLQKPKPMQEMPYALFTTNA